MVSTRSTWQYMTHIPHTKYGGSDHRYGGLDESIYSLPPMGVGQGSDSGSTGYSMITSSMFDGMHRRGLAMMIPTPLSLTPIDLSDGV